VDSAEVKAVLYDLGSNFYATLTEGHLPLVDALPLYRTSLVPINGTS